MKLKALILSLLIITSCGIKIDSVYDESRSQQPYSNTLIVLPHDNKWTKRYSKNLESNLATKLEGKNVEFLVIENNEEELTLSKDNKLNSEISKILEKDQKDLILYCTYNSLSYSNGRMIYGEFEINGFDVKENKEVWKAQYKMNTTMNPRRFAKKTSEVIAKKLKEDKMI